MAEYAVFAVAPPDAYTPRYLTPLKLYRVRELEGRAFQVLDDEDTEILCLWYGCGHLNCGSWKRIEIPLADVPYDQREGETMCKP